MKQRSLSVLLLVSAAAFVAAGCTPLHKVHINDSTLTAQDIGVEHAYGRGNPLREPLLSVASGTTAPVAINTPSRWAQTPPLSPGDRLQIDIEDGETFSGRYEVDMDGTVKLPHLPALQVAGEDTKHAERAIGKALVSAELFKAHRIRVSVRVHEWAHIQVHVSGAVFNPGMVSVNARSPEERALKPHLVSGDFASERMLTAALRSAGGVRPDAAVGDIRLIRNGKTLVVSYAGLTQGHAIPQIPLMSGDTIVVPSSGRFDANLVTPSAITPPGIRVFLSNLTVPATGNAISAVSKDASSLPYGSRLLTAAVSANCVGGVNSTSASRFAVLVRTDPLTGREEVLERAIHDLLQAPHHDAINPFVMPNDSIACYDSGVTNLRDLARILYEIILPLSLL
ncbi:MAG: polysaccharide biosynthesis/export family protein [Gammaproteobacteria bacterium]